MLSTFSVTIRSLSDNLIGIAAPLNDIMPLPVLLSNTYVACASPLILRKITVPSFWKISTRWSVELFHGPTIEAELETAAGVGVEAGVDTQPVNDTANIATTAMRTIPF